MTHNTGGRPAQYPLIADELRKRLYAGAYRANDKMPPIRLLAKEFGVCQSTMLRAFRILKQEGLTWANGYGTFVTAVAAPEGDKVTAWQTLVSFGIPEDVVTDVLLAHAHELAERQRWWADRENFILPVEVDGRDVPTVARQVAGILTGLIDPSKEA
jgi:DNA-binding transcriptional regulator YhcF (GntR family)